MNGLAGALIVLGWFAVVAYLLTAPSEPTAQCLCPCECETVATQNGTQRKGENERDRIDD